jgi:hypothetical protein
MEMDSLTIDASINVAAFSSKSLSRTSLVYGRQRTISVAPSIIVVSGGRNSAVSGYVGQSVTLHGTSALLPNLKPVAWTNIRMEILACQPSKCGRRHHCSDVYWLLWVFSLASIQTRSGSTSSPRDQVLRTTTSGTCQPSHSSLFGK